MVGIILTLIAILFVICFAFYFSDSPFDRGVRNDALFFAVRKERRKNSGIRL